MRLVLTAAILAAFTGAAWADGASAVLDHHVAMMKKGDLEGVLSDYADNAVIVTPHGVAPGQKDVSGSDVFVGKAQARALFATLTDKDHNAGARSMLTRYEPVGNDTTLMHWVQFKGTPKEVSGYDVFVTRGGKIAYQTVVVNPAKK